MSSRLFQVVREREGLVYSIHSGNAAFRDSGLFYVYAGTEPAHFRRVVDLTLRELRTLRADGVTADELRRAKDHLKGSLMLSLESTGSRMTRIAKQELYFGQSFTLDQILADIERVTLADLESPGRSGCSSEPLSLVALGPKGPEVRLPDGIRALRRTSPMIPRYTRPEMGALWSDGRAVRAAGSASSWRCARPGPAAASSRRRARRIRQRARVDAARIADDRGAGPPRRHRLPDGPRGARSARTRGSSTWG